MEIIEFNFEKMSDSAQFCTDVAIHSFHEEGFIEFRAYCIINSMAKPVNIELVRIEENEYKCHVLTVCELLAMSERCILVSGKLTCGEVNHQLRITAKQKIIEK